MLIRIKENVVKINYKYHILALLLSFFRTYSLYFYLHYDDILSTNYKKVIVFGIRFIGYFIFYESLLFLGGWIKNKNFLLKYIININRGGSGWKDFIVFALGWLPSLIIKYPGAMCWDTWRMLYEFRTKKITAHHSVFYTVCLGELVGFFEQIGHPNWGLWVFIFFQYIIIVFVFGYAVGLLRKLHIREPVIYSIIGLWIINPYIIGYQGVAIKDNLYSAFLFLLSMLLIEISIDSRNFCNKWYKNVLIYLSVIGTCLFRKNGFYLIGILIVVCFIHVLRNKKGYISVVILVTAYIFSNCVSYQLEKHYNVIPSSIAEALSFPFQQTARYVKYYEEDVTENEQEIIRLVLDYDTLANRYNPRISDPVKNTYKGDAHILPSYFKIWFQQFLRHPLCYMEATWEQNYYLFVPEASANNIVFYQDIDVGYELGNKIIVSEKTKYFEPIFSVPKILSDWQEWVIFEYNLLHQMPVSSILGNISFYMYLLICMIGVMIINKKQWLLGFLPAIVNVMFVILGPAIQGHPRYMFPVIYSAPVLLAYVIYSNDYM